jgi:hypothetical protein
MINQNSNNSATPFNPSYINVLLIGTNWFVINFTASYDAIPPITPAIIYNLAPS